MELKPLCDFRITSNHHKYLTWTKGLIKSDKHTSLLQQRFSYHSKSFIVKAVGNPFSFFDVEA